MTKVFEITSAHWADPARHDGRWVLRGRAHEDVKLGDKLTLAGVQAAVESITSYGKETDLLSKMMTGALLVRCSEDDSPMWLRRRP